MSVKKIGNLSKYSGNEHGVAKRKESISFPNGCFICAKDRFPSGQCTHQHDQGALRKMEIGNQAIDALETITDVQGLTCKISINKNHQVIRDAIIFKVGETDFEAVDSYTISYDD